MYYQETHQINSSQFMYKVYGWMSAALAITAGVAFYISTMQDVVKKLFSSPGLLIGLFVVQLGLVIGLSAFITRLNFAAAMTLFLVYAASVGVTTSAIFLVYTTTSIYATFLVTAGMFGLMSMYGYFTQTDLTTVGNISIMALWGIILASLVNMFFQNAAVDYVISFIGVIVFTALTAYDTQKIKHLASSMIADRETLNKVAILGALTLYLDFLNLFLLLLRFMGNRRQD